MDNYFLQNLNLQKKFTNYFAKNLTKISLQIIFYNKIYKYFLLTNLKKKIDKKYEFLIMFLD